MFVGNSLLGSSGFLNPAVFSSANRGLFQLSTHISSFTPTFPKPQIANKRQTLLLEKYCLVCVDVTRFLWEGRFVWEEFFGEQLAGNADSSQQTGHRRVSVIVSLRENMNVCQKDC